MSDISAVGLRGLQSVVICVLLCLSSAHSIAQDNELTAEQRSMLDQLPPAQRQQALSAIQDLREERVSTTQNAASSLVEPLSGSGNETQSRFELSSEDTDEARAEPHSRLVVEFTPAANEKPATTFGVPQSTIMDDFEGTQFFVLDEAGFLKLPGMDPIDLFGLTSYEIAKRLAAEKELRVFEIDALLLGNSAISRTKLEPFGYDFFNSLNGTFKEVTSGPVPPDYVLGPGDSVRMQLFGSINRLIESEVSRDGLLNLPELGPIMVAGLSFSEFRRDVERRVEQTLIGTEISVTMGQLRSIRLFVTGEVVRPGSYVVGSLATISSALYQSGGIGSVGSLRNVQLKRNGKVVGALDLYDLLLRGDNSDDLRLQPGDVVFVPPVGSQVALDGAVKRPGVYEVKSGATFADVLTLAGGVQSDAFPQASRVERILETGQRVTLSRDFGDRTVLENKATNGDTIFVPRVLEEVDRSISLIGHVQRPGAQEWRPGMRLTDVISSELQLRAGADPNYILIRRQDAQTRRPRAVSADLTAALQRPGSAHDIELQPKDEIYVFDMTSGRQRILGPFLDELELRSGHSEPFAAISVVGEVRAPGTYPMEKEMRVSDLLRAGGGLSEEAYSLRAEIARYEVVDGEFRDSKILDIDLGRVLDGDVSSDIVLEPHDNLRISVLPSWDRLWSVEIVGEVVFPGQYRIRNGETLSELLRRAGGLTDEAFPEGTVFLRESLRQREQEQIDVLASRLEADLAALSLEKLDNSGAQALVTGQELLSQLRETEALGRLVIELRRTESEGGTDFAVDEVFLRDGDRLLIPKVMQEVTVIGETQQNTSHLHRPGLSRVDYIGLSGGLTRRADKKLIYVVRANGAVQTDGRSRWLGRSQGLEIRPGDTIVVPIETDRIRPLTLWSSVTQILYQAAIAIAAVQTFDN